MREIPWTDGSRHPVGKILCVGRNYADHAKEMNAPAEPVVFLKPATAVVPPGNPVRLPRDRGAVHFEAELVAQLVAGGTGLDAAAAAACVGAYGLGLDLTLRDVQAKAKEKGQPWALAKGFDGSLPVTEFVPAAEVVDPGALTFRLLLDGEVRQEGRAADMLLGVGELLAYMSTWITLEPGDLILTGTPAGVGPVEPGRTARLELSTGLAGEIRFV